MEFPCQVMYYMLLTFGLAMAILSPQMLDLSVDICGLYYNCSHRYPSEEEKARHIPLIRCPECGCNPVDRDDLLCPDQEEFRTCADKNIYSASSLTKDIKIIPMIETCFEEANDTLNDLCSNAKRDLLNRNSYIVTGFRKGMYSFFRNMYCFQCNNGSNLGQLQLEVTYCESQSFDVNTYSSVGELLHHVEKASCEFGYKTHSYKTYCSESNIISECNVTGMWDTWDEEVNAACSTYEGKFLVFKNIFCYACNTGKSDFTPSIRSCIDHENEGVELECLNGPADPRTFPYWNKYCRKCNELPGVSYGLDHVNIYNKSAEYPFEGSVYFGIRFCDLRNSDAYKFLTLSPTVEYLCTLAYRRFTHDELKASFDVAYQVFMKKKRESALRVHWPDLYNEYLRLGGKDKWWGGLEEECWHDSYCYKIQNCCPEPLGDNALECRELGGRNVTVINKCPNLFSDKVWKYYCERNESEMLTTLDIFPFYKKNYADPYFRNVFCHMCNELTTSTYVIQSGGYIHFKCKKYIDIENFLPLLIGTSILGETCHMEYKTRGPSEPPSCSLESYKFDKDAAKCVIPTNATLASIEMKDMCENTGPYVISTCKKKYVNIFCEMCSLYNECEHANGTCEMGVHMQNSKLCDLQEEDTRITEVQHFYELQFDLNIAFISRYNTPDLKNNSTGHCTDLEFYDVVTVSDGGMYTGGQKKGFMKDK